MAEALVIVGIAASILQIIDIGGRVLDCLGEYKSKFTEVPETFRSVHEVLPILRDVLTKTKAAIDSGSVPRETVEALLPVVTSCASQIQILDEVLEKSLPKNNSWGERTRKAFYTVAKDSKVQGITSEVLRYVSVLTFYYAATTSTLRPRTDDKLERIRHWLSAPDPFLNYHKALRQRLVGTGEWFLEGARYCEWKTTASSFLWLHGIPGSGKSVLSAGVLEDVMQTSEKDVGKAVAFFYFDFTDTQKRSCESMIKALITQLSQQCIKIPTALDALYTSCRKGEHRPSADALFSTLKQMILEFPESYLVLDALDECDNWDEALGVLQNLESLESRNLHILVTSRKERDIERSLTSFLTQECCIDLQAALVDEDIRRYVHHRWSNDRNLEKWKSKPRIQAEVEEALFARTNGMFRWTVCQLDALGKCLNLAKLRRALKNLPRTLAETYERILNSIDENSEYARKILQWLAFSKRPLRVEEIAEVVAIDENGGSFNEDEVLADPDDVITICSSLVTITREDDTGYRFVSLAHYSVQEFLLSISVEAPNPIASYRVKSGETNAFIARSCLAYLLRFQSPDDLLSSDTFDGYKLADYSARFWISHAQATENDIDSITQLARNLFSARETAYLNWIRIHDPDFDYYWRSPKFKETIDSVPIPLYYASLAGLLRIVQYLITDTGADVNAQGGQYGNALQVASYRGHKEVVERLLEAGADVNAQGGCHSNALYAASSEGHREVVERLLEAGADVNAQGGRYGSALQAALFLGHKEVAERLLDARADVNAQGGRYGSALQVASLSGYREMVERLLDAGAEVNVQSWRYGSALQAASRGGHKEMVERLLEVGADVNAQAGKYDSALQVASYWGHMEVAKLLLDAGADVNLQGGRYGSALQVASYWGYMEVVGRLLEAGADANAHAGRYGNALQAASYGGHKEVVERLLKAGAEVNAQGGQYGNALHAASSMGHKEVAERLVGAGADINVQAK